MKKFLTIIGILIIFVIVSIALIFLIFSTPVGIGSIKTINPEAVIKAKDITEREQKLINTKTPIPITPTQNTSEKKKK